jgi:cystathionine beta-lyase/cystathionine gamma-synthase
VDLTTTLPSLPQVQSLVNIGVTKEKEDNANAVLAAEKQRAQLVLNEAISNRDQAVADLNNVEERCVVVVIVVAVVAVAVAVAVCVVQFYYQAVNAAGFHRTGLRTLQRLTIALFLLLLCP